MQFEDGVNMLAKLHSMAKAMNEKISHGISTFNTIKMKNQEKAYKLFLSRKVLPKSQIPHPLTPQLLKEPLQIDGLAKTYNLKFCSYYTPPLHTSMLSKEQQEQINKRMKDDVKYIDLQKNTSVALYIKLKKLLRVKQGQVQVQDAENRNSKCWFKIKELSQKVKNLNTSASAVIIKKIDRERLVTL